MIRAIGAIFLMLACASSQALAYASTQQLLQQGFLLAQACETEIDDDMTDYGQCIGHAVDRIAGQKSVLLGVHFQAWLMADLAARQNSTHALALRMQHAQGMAKHMRARKITLDQLCQAKQMRCESIKDRLAQRLQ